MKPLGKITYRKGSALSAGQSCPCTHLFLKGIIMLNNGKTASAVREVIDAAKSQTVPFISIASIGAAVRSMQDVSAVLETAKQTQSSAAGTISKAVKQAASQFGPFAVVEDVPALGAVLAVLCIPASKEKYQAMIAGIEKGDFSDWQAAYAGTKEVALKNDDAEKGTESNKTAAYNTAKQALSRIRQSVKKAVEEAEAAAQAEIRAAEAQAEQQRIAAFEAAEAERKEAERKAAEMEREAERQDLRAALAMIDSLKSQVAKLQSDNDALRQELSAAKSGKKAKASA